MDKTIFSKSTVAELLVYLTSLVLTKLTTSYFYTVGYALTHSRPTSLASTSPTTFIGIGITFMFIGVYGTVMKKWHHPRFLLFVLCAPLVSGLVALLAGYTAGR